MVNKKNGLVIGTRDVGNPPPSATLIAAALSAAKLDYTWAQYNFPEPELIGIGTKNMAVLFVMPK